MSATKANPGNTRDVLRRDLYEAMQESQKTTLGQKLIFIEEHMLNHDDYSESEVKKIRDMMFEFEIDLRERLNRSCGDEAIFQIENHQWLQGVISFPKGTPRSLPGCLASSPGERLKSAKRTVIDIMTMMVVAKFSLRDYKEIQEADPDRYPSYEVIEKDFNECFPAESADSVDENGVEIDLQSLLDLTVKRIMQEEKLDKFENGAHFTLISKWGYHGAHLGMGQVLAEFEPYNYLFQGSFVYLELKSATGRTIWRNPSPSSSRYHRLIKFRFIEEEQALIQEEIRQMQTAVENLIEGEIPWGEKDFKVKHQISYIKEEPNAPTNTAPVCCSICGECSNDFNKLEKRNVEVGIFDYGVSLSDAWISIYEALLDLAYKLPIRKSRPESKREKEKVKKQKAKIREAFLIINVRIDKPKSRFEGFGDECPSRIFFENKELTSAITGIDLALLRKFDTILEVISSEDKINKERYRSHAGETAELYVSLYGWHPMTLNVHKILMHGLGVIKPDPLPIAQSYEVSVARDCC